MSMQGQAPIPVSIVNSSVAVADSAAAVLTDRVGATNETAAATDTATSGINGLLKRIAQRLTSLIALLPASLGQKTVANSLAVVVSSDQSAIPVTLSGVATAAGQALALAGATSIASGQVTAGAAATLAAARATRRCVTILNTDALLSVYIGPATVTSGNGMLLRAGVQVRIETTALIQVLAASGSPVVTYMEEYD